MGILVNIMAAFLRCASSVGTEHLVLPVLQRIPYASVCLRHTLMCSWHSTGRKVPIGIRQASRTWLETLRFQSARFWVPFWNDVVLAGKQKCVLLLLFFSICQNKCCFYQLSHFLYWYKLICSAQGHGRPGSVMYLWVVSVLRLYI